MRPFRLLSLLLVAGLLVGACDFFDQQDRTFTDDPKLEFFPLSETVDEGGDDGNSNTTVTVDVQLIGRQRDSDLPVSFSVDDSSTAVEGEHYQLPSTSATIPANASETDVQIEVLDNNQDDGDSNYVLYLTLDDSEGVVAAENLKTHTLTIRGTDE